MGGQRKKKGGRATAKGGTAHRRLTADQRAGLDDIFAGILRSAATELSGDTAPLVVELWASQVWGMWHQAELVGMDATAVFAGGCIDYATRRATPAALAVLRALAAVAPEPYGARARRAADELSRSGVAGPPWTDSVGVATPVDASLSFDPVHDDGVSVMVMFDGPAGLHTVGVYIDHNLGAMAKDAFAVPAGIDELIERLGQRGDEDPPEYRRIPLPEAAARWRHAFAQTDRTMDPPTSEDLPDLRALIVARLATMPSGGELPVPPEVSDVERAELLSAFLGSDEAAGLFAGDDADDSLEDLGAEVMNFSFDYVWGAPLRFSPVMVEIFCLDWAPRKIAADEDAFRLLPGVLAAWIRFAGRRRGIPEKAIDESVGAADGYAKPMIELAADPAQWGPGKAIALAMQKRGIDMTDQSAIDGFIDEINGHGGIDWLTDSAGAP